jgi:hypothetical protein
MPLKRLKASKDSDRDERAWRQDLAAVVTGALSGALGGLLLGTIVADSVPYGLLLGVGLGALIGALFGRFVSGRMNPDDFDPGYHQHPYVGAHAPDDDETADRAARPR